MGKDEDVKKLVGSVGNAPPHWVVPGLIHVIVLGGASVVNWRAATLVVFGFALEFLAYQNPSKAGHVLNLFGVSNPFAKPAWWTSFHFPVPAWWRLAVFFVLAIAAGAETAFIATLVLGVVFTVAWWYREKFDRFGWWNIARDPGAIWIGPVTAGLGLILFSNENKGVIALVILALVGVKVVKALGLLDFLDVENKTKSV